MGYANRGSQSPRRRTPLGDTFSNQAEGEEPQRNQTSPLATEFRPKTPTRPPTGKKEPSYTNPLPMPGALPPTPGASEGESSAEGDGDGERVFADYVVVAKDGDLPPPVPPPRSSHRPAS
jgi:hypothetical protein